MDRRHDVHHVHDEQNEHLLREILRQLRILNHKESATMANLDALRQQVERDTEVTSSAVTLLNQLADEIRNAGTDQDALNDLADRISSNSDELAAAVAANTAADETGEEPAPEEPEPV